MKAALPCLRLPFAAVLCAALFAATATTAEPISGKAAKKALFAPLKAEVQIMPEAGLAADQAQTLALVGESQPYYGAVALAPDEGLMSEATVAAANFHDTASAAAAALADCNGKRKTASDCVIAAYIRPKGWKDAAFGLSSDATASFKSYDMKTGALAISAATGAFGMAAGAGAGEKALANCAAKNEMANDCVVAVQD